MSHDRWQEVKDKVEGLGLKLKLHLDQEHDETDDTRTAGDTRAAIEEMSTKLQEALNGFGNAAKDPAIRADMKDLGELLRDAMNETFSTVGAEVGGILKKTKGEMAGGSAPSDPEPSDAGSADGGSADEAGDAADELPPAS